MLEELDYTCGMNITNTPDLDKLLITEDDVYAACAGAHAVCIMTEWDSFKTLEWATRVYPSMVQPAFLFDGRNILDHRALRDIGFEVYAVGKPVRGDMSAVQGSGMALPVASPIATSTH